MWSCLHSSYCEGRPLPNSGTIKRPQHDQKKKNDVTLAFMICGVGEERIKHYSHCYLSNQKVNVVRKRSNVNWITFYRRENRGRYPLLSNRLRQKYYINDKILYLINNLSFTTFKFTFISYKESILTFPILL